MASIIICCLSISLIIIIISLNIVDTSKDAVEIRSENEMKALMDQSVDPCDDFYQYACGNWDKVHPIPDYRGNLNVLQMLTERNFKILDKLLRNNTKAVQHNNNNPSAEEAVKVFYASCNNIDLVNKRGVQPLLDLFKSLGGWPVLDSNWTTTNFDWLELAINVKSMLNTNFLFRTIIFKDIFNNTGKFLPTFVPPSTILTDLNVTLYKERILEILQKFNINDKIIKKTAEEILDFESELKKLVVGGKSMTMTLATLENEIPLINWRRYLFGVFDYTFHPSDLVSVFGLEFFNKLPKFLEQKTPRVVANYILWNVVDKLLIIMGDDFVNIIDNYNHKIQGFKSPLPRWRFCLDIMVDVMNTPTASLFVKETLPKDSLSDIKRLAEEIKETARQVFENTSWPRKAIREKSFEKLNALHIDMSYENFIYDNKAIDEEYKDANIDYDKFFESYLGLKQLLLKNDAKLYKTQFENGIWPYPLIYAEAIQIGNENKLNPYPGLIQPPFYHHNSKKFFHYSGIGMVLSHEIFHSFDDIGAHYNIRGQYSSWWSDDDFEEYENRKKCFVDQYKNYSINGIPIDTDDHGPSENIADNMGLKLSFNTYDNWLKVNPEANKDEVIDGLDLTGRQLFFVGAAQISCNTIRPEAVDYVMSMEPQSPGKYRAVGMIVNSKEFAEQFKCAKDSRMNPEKKCTIL